jgi:hypothetical protein
MTSLLMRSIKSKVLKLELIDLPPEKMVVEAEHERAIRRMCRLCKQPEVNYGVPKFWIISLECRSEVGR